jgi:16S rRNA (uracil1498-N3)-methyltransferase
VRQKNEKTKSERVRELPRFLVSYSNLIEQFPFSLTLDESEAHHARSVLRLTEGDAALFIEPQRGIAYKGEFISISKNSVQVNLLEQSEVGEKSHTTLFLALPKKQQLDFICEKATEVGVDKIILFPSERSQGVRDDPEFLDRLKRITISALKQSGQLFLPQIIFYKDLDKALESISSSKTVHYLCLAPREETSLKEGHSPLSLLTELYERNSQNKLQSPPNNVDLILGVGSEGGFSVNEVSQFLAANFIPVTLGASTLRCETAALGALLLTQLCK